MVTKINLLNYIVLKIKCFNILYKHELLPKTPTTLTLLINVYNYEYMNGWKTPVHNYNDPYLWHDQGKWVGCR